jgi:CBS domain-containing protein
MESKTPAKAAFSSSKTSKPTISSTTSSVDETTAATTPISFLSSRVGTIARPDMIILESDTSVENASRRMAEKNFNNVLVSARGEVVGIVSKTDILFKVLSQNSSPSKVRLREIMTSPVIAVRPDSTVQEALYTMEKHNIRQIFVHAFNAITGTISREDIYQRIEQLSITTEDTALTGMPACIIDSRTISYVKDLSKANYVCPYCQSPFDTKEGLSKHLDRLHNDFDAGVLEGDVRSMFE